MLRSFVPTNENLELCSLSEQRLTTYTSRILLTMKKKKSNLAQKDSESNSISLVENLTCHEKENEKLYYLNEFRNKYFMNRKM
jgi:hypothetical protein